MKQYNHPRYCHRWQGLRTAKWPAQSKAQRGLPPRKDREILVFPFEFPIVAGEILQDIPNLQYPAKKYFTSSHPHPDILCWHSLWHYIWHRLCLRTQVYWIYLDSHLRFFTGLRSRYIEDSWILITVLWLLNALQRQVHWIYEYSWVLIIVFMAFQFDILSGILPGIYSDILPDILSDIFRYSIWHIFQHSNWHSDILSAILSGILSGIYSGILSGNLPGIYSDILSGTCSDILSDLRYIVTFVLTFFLAFCLTYVLIWQSFWPSVWHVFRSKRAELAMRFGLQVRNWSIRALIAVDIHCCWRHSEEIWKSWECW